MTHKQTYVLLESLPFVKRIMSASQDYARREHRLYAAHRELVTQAVRLPNGEIVNQTVVEESDIPVMVPAIPSLDRHRAMKIFDALVVEYLSQALLYRVHESPIHEIAQALRGHPTPDVYDERLAEEFISTEEVEEIIHDITSQIAVFVGSGTWREWALYGQGFTRALIGGRDHRVEWYETQHGLGYDTTAIEVDIHALASIISNNVARYHVYAVATLPLADLIADGINAILPMVVFPTHLSLSRHPWFADQNIVNYDEFCEAYAHAPLQAFIQTFLRPRMSANTLYVANITEDFTLVLNKAEPTHMEETRKCQEIRESIERGDWVPPNDIERLREYDRRH